MSDDTNQSPDLLTPPGSKKRVEAIDEERERTTTKRHLRSERTTLTKKIDVQRTTRDILALAKEFGAKRGADLQQATVVVASHVVSDMTTLQRDDVPVREKVLMGLRAIAAVTGALWVGKQLNRLWTYLFGTGFISTMGKIGVGVGAFFAGAHLIANDLRKQPPSDTHPTLDTVASDNLLTRTEPISLDGVMLRAWVHSEGFTPELRVSANTHTYRLQTSPAGAQLLRFLTLKPLNGYVVLGTGQRIARAELTRIARELSTAAMPTIEGNVMMEKPNGTGGFTASSVRYVFQRLPSP